MEEKEFNKESSVQYRQSMDPCDKRFNDRRQNTCEGFTYVSMVGWICRREQERRKNNGEER